MSKPFFDFIPKFSGWGMKTGHVLPWNDEYNWDVFRKTQKYVEESSNFSMDGTGMSKKYVRGLIYRHWYIAYCTKHVI